MKKMLSLILTVVMLSSSLMADEIKLTPEQRVETLRLLMSGASADEVLAGADVNAKQAVQVMLDAKIIDQEMVDYAMANPEKAIQGELEFPQGSAFFSVHGTVAVMWVVGGTVITLLGLAVLL